MVDLTPIPNRSFQWGPKVTANFDALNAAKLEEAEVAAIADERAEAKFLEVVADPEDATVAALVETSASATATALNSTYPAKQISPRETSRIQSERRATFNVDQMYPNSYVDHKIVLAEYSTLWAVGTDSCLRKSTDAGLSWGGRLYYPGGLGQLAKSGLFYKTAAGTLLTTFHPFDLSAPKIIRSTDGGTTWSDVVAAQTNVDYLGPTNICQDPVSGHLYLGEYVTVSAATAPTFKIVRSTNDGATWSTFKTFDRSGANAVRHCHGIQWDPISARVYVVCGDSDIDAGIYRVNAGGTALEPVVLRNQVPSDIWPGAVGLMFFPNYIAWGIDQSSDAHLVRMARSEIGQASPLVEKVATLQSTAFYTARVSDDEWLMTVSNEDGTGGRLDNAMHIYRVSDDASVIDEVLTVPTNRETGFSWIYPVSRPDQANPNGNVWLGSNVPAPSDPDPNQRGFQFSARLGWGGMVLPRPDVAGRRPFYQPVTVNSGFVSLVAGEKKVFAVTEVPPRATRLYILETNREQLSGSGFVYVEVYDQTGAAILKMEDGTTNMQWQNRSRRAALTEASAAYIARSAPLAPGRQIRFRMNEILNQPADAVGSITFAWGF